jgi:hypothetical protein
MWLEGLTLPSLNGDNRVGRAYNVYGSGRLTLPSLSQAASYFFNLVLD